jgi:hypothetical protein
MPPLRIMDLNLIASNRDSRVPLGSFIREISKYFFSTVISLMLK